MARTSPLQTDEGAAQAERARNGKRVLLGILLLVLALILWELRNVAPTWLATSLTTSARFTTQDEPDNARITRAFEAVRQTMSAAATLEPESDKGQIRHTVLTVVAPTSSAAVETVTRMAAAMDKACSREGPGLLQVSVSRRARPVENRATEAAG